MWPCWTQRRPHGARKQWNLLSFQRPVPTCSLKSVEKYRLLCFVCCRHSQRWPAECSNHDAIKQTRTTLIGLNHWPKRCKENHAKWICKSIHVLTPHLSATHSQSQFHPQLRTSSLFNEILLSFGVLQKTWTFYWRKLTPPCVTSAVDDNFILHKSYLFKLARKLWLFT